MGAFFLNALAGSLTNFVQHIAKVIVCFLAFTILVALLEKVLPDDPFRGVITGWADFIRPYGAVLNTFIPVNFIEASLFFVTAERYFVWLYKKVYSIVMDKDADEALDV